MNTRTPPSKQAAAPVSLHIERLVLDGFKLSPAQGAQMQRALEMELIRLAAMPQLGQAWHGGAVPATVAPSVQLAATARPSELGRAVARSVFAALRRSP